MNLIPTIYTVGYHGLASIAELLARFGQLSGDVHIVDVRAYPNSGSYVFRSDRMSEYFGRRYVSLTALGNPSRRLPWQPPDWDRAALAVAGVAAAVDAGRTVVLLCACPRTQDCHRLAVAEAVVGYLGGCCTISNL